MDDEVDEIARRWISVPEDLDGIEEAVGIRAVTIAMRLDVKSIARLANLPELTHLALAGVRVPRGIEKLHSVLSVALCAPSSADFTRLAALRSLRELEIDDASELPASIARLVNLERLAIAGSLAVLPKQLGKLAKLRWLILGKTKISVLPDEVCELAALEELVATRTRLRRLPTAIGRLANLRVLHVGWGHMRKLPASLVELAKLRVLDLPWMIEALPAGFERLRLEEYDGPFEKLVAKLEPSADVRDLRVTELEPVPAGFGDPITLLVELPNYRDPLPQFAKLRRVQELRLAVRDPNAALAQLTKARALKKLRITGAKTLPDAVGMLDSIVTLILDGTTSLTPAIGKLVNLETLYLWFPTILKKLPRELAKCASLSMLVINDASRITNLEMLANVRSLRRVSLTNAKHTQLVAMCAATQIEELDLEGFGIAKLPAELGGMTGLVRLDVHRTGIKAIPELPPSLRWICVPHTLGGAKAQLRHGRWKKGARRDYVWFERTD